MEIPAGRSRRLLQRVAHLSVVQRTAAGGRDIGAALVALPAAGGRGLDRQGRRRDAPTAFDSGLAKVNRVVRFSQPARHMVGDLAAAEPPLRPNGFELAATALQRVIMNAETKGF